MPPKPTISFLCSMPPEIVESSKVWLPILTFFLGFFARTFVMSAADRAANKRAKFELSKKLADDQNAAYQKLMDALTKFASKKTKPKLEDFFSISGPAQNYLYQQKATADAIMADMVDPQSRDGTFVPKLTETADKVIPAVYQKLKEIADKHGLPHTDQFDRANYQSIFDVVEKFGGRATVARQSN